MQSLIARFKSLLTGPQEATLPSVEGIYPTTLAGLPPELLLSICDFLSPVDLICLSLCSHRLRELYLRRIARLLPRTKDDKILILNRLERDLPQYFTCEICKIFHRVDEYTNFLPDELYLCHLPCVVEWQAGLFVNIRTHTNSRYSGSHLSFLQLKLAMRRFFYGRTYGISTNSLLYTQVRQAPPQAIHPDIIALFSREAQVCPHDPGLYIRLQDIALINKLDDLLFDPGFRLVDADYESPIKSWEICWHRKFPSRLGDLVEYFRAEGDAALDSTCPKCNTEACIEILEFDSQIAVSLTKWVNLGPGLTKESLLWSMHSQLPLPPGPRGKLDIDDLERFLATQSPRSCFENASRQSFEKLRSHNLSYLKDHQYRTIMPFNPRENLWHISYEGPAKRRKTPSKILFPLQGWEQSPLTARWN